VSSPIIHADMAVFPAPTVVLNDCPFLDGRRRRRRCMPPAFAALRVLAQMRLRLIVR
jgi:hypothetical protein